jgi:hypothetical protein
MNVTTWKNKTAEHQNSQINSQDCQPTVDNSGGEDGTRSGYLVDGSFDQSRSNFDLCHLAMLRAEQ